MHRGGRRATAASRTNYMPCRGPQALSGALAAEAAVRQSAMLVYALGLKAIGRGGSDTFAFVSDCSRKGIPAPGLVSHCDIAWAPAPVGSLPRLTSRYKELSCLQ